MRRSRSRSGNETPLRARRRIFAYGALGLLAIAISAGISLRPLLSGRSESRQVRAGDHTLQQVFELRTTLADWQVFAEPFFARVSVTGVKIDPAELAKGATIAQTVPPQVQAVATDLRDSGFTPTARTLESGSAKFSNTITNLAPLIEGTSTTKIAAATAAERAAYMQLWTGSEAAAAQLRQARDVDLHQTVAHLDNGRATVLAVDVFAAVAAVCTTFIVGRRRAAPRTHRARRVGRRAFETALQRALEMSKAEADVYEVVNRALHRAVPRLQVEMLVADSSRAHFHQTLSTATGGPDDRTGLRCRLAARMPGNHPRAHAAVPEQWRARRLPLSARPDHGELLGGVCAGQHRGQDRRSRARDGARRGSADGDGRALLEFTARRASERIAMLRAFEKSETQARSDPLTGLLNRRSLENRVNDLQRERAPYALAYGDLDHFKILNDTHGHEAGDQALRLFARVLRDSLRPNDIAAATAAKSSSSCCPTAT